MITGEEIRLLLEQTERCWNAGDRDGISQALERGCTG